MRAAAARAGRRLGYRGGALIVTGVGWIDYGAGLVADPRYGIVRGVTALSFHGHVPIGAWGWVWIASGAAACCAAVLRAGRDWWGWAAAAAMPSVWACAYTVARAVGAYPQGWYAGITWAVYPSLLAILAVATRRLVHVFREVAVLRREVAALRLNSGEEQRG